MLYENIKRIAKEKGKSINRLEKDCDFGKAVISKWNDHRPSIDKVAKVASILGASIDDLMAEE